MNFPISRSGGSALIYGTRIAEQCSSLPLFLFCPDVCSCSSSSSSSSRPTSVSQYGRWRLRCCLFRHYKSLLGLSQFLLPSLLYSRSVWLLTLHCTYSEDAKKEESILLPRLSSFVEIEIEEEEGGSGLNGGGFGGLLLLLLGCSSGKSNAGSHNNAARERTIEWLSPSSSDYLLIPCRSLLLQQHSTQRRKAKADRRPLAAAAAALPHSALIGSSITSNASANHCVSPAP